MLYRFEHKYFTFLAEIIYFNLLKTLKNNYNFFSRTVTTQIIGHMCRLLASYL